MNPIIYSIFNREFREAFRRVLDDARRRVSCWGQTDAAARAGVSGRRGKYGAVQTRRTSNSGAAAYGELLATLEDAPSLDSPRRLMYQVSTSVWFDPTVCLADYDRRQQLQQQRLQLWRKQITLLFSFCIISSLHRVRKKSLRYFRHDFDKLKPIFIIFGMSRPEYSLD